MHRTACQEFHDHSQEFIAPVLATPTLLLGGRGVIKGEEQPKRSILQPPDARSILDKVIGDIGSLIDLQFDCSLLISALVAYANS